MRAHILYIMLIDAEILSRGKMQRVLFVSVIISLSLICIVSANWGLHPTFSFRKRLPCPLVDVPPSRHEIHLQDSIKLKEWLQNQQPLMGNNIAIPSSDTPIVSDVLPKNHLISIFASLTRQFEPIESRLNDLSKNTTILAPRNSAMLNLPHKPWENPEDYENFGKARAYEGKEGEKRASRNIQRFVEAHLIPVSPWKEGEEIETLGGGKLWWTKNGDKIFIQPGNVEVDRIAEKVSNGEVWILNGGINYR